LVGLGVQLLGVSSFGWFFFASSMAALLGKHPISQIKSDGSNRQQGAIRKIPEGLQMK